MKFGCEDFSTVLNCILDAAADHLRIAKILVQMGLDPSNITYDTLFDRLTEIALAYVTLANMFALVGAILFVATLLMKTMVPLRVANMAGCTFFVVFGALSRNVALFSCICCSCRSMPFASAKCSSSSGRHAARRRVIRRWNGSNRS